MKFRAAPNFHQTRDYTHSPRAVLSLLSCSACRRFAYRKPLRALDGPNRLPHHWRTPSGGPRTRRCGERFDKEEAVRSWAISAVVAVLAAGLSAIAVDAQGGAVPPHAGPVTATMRTVLLPPVLAPPAAGQSAAAAVATTTTTTGTPSVGPATPAASPEPSAQPGPQPQTPAVTVQVPQCVVTWQVPIPEPGAPPGVYEGSYQATYGGDCTTANAVAAAHPGSSVQQVTLPMTSDQTNAAQPVPTGDQ